MRKRIPRRAGFTLVEMVVTVALLAVLTTMTAMVVLPMTRASYKASELAEMNRVYETLSGELLTDIERAIEPLEAADGELTVTTPDGRVTYTAPDGIICKAVDGGEAKPVLEPGYYRGWRAEFSLDGEEALYTLTLTLSNSEGDALVPREYKVRPLVLTQGE